MAVTVDPSEVETFGHALAVRADSIGAVRLKLAQRLSQATWSGTGASRFRFNAQQLDRRLAGDVDDLRRLTAAFQRLAEALAEELRALRQIEDKVRVWLALNPTRPPPWPPSALPVRGDPKWREVERAFLQAGVPLDAVAVSGAPGVPVAAGRTGDWKATLSPSEAWIIERESGFDPMARNPSSGAFGIWQGLGATLDTWADHFGYERDTTDPWEQLDMFRAYVKDRYGTAEKAVQFWQKNNWY